MWTTPPAKVLSPTAATALPGSTPHLCRYRTLSAMPPTFAGDTRLTNEEASWVSTLGPNGSRWVTDPVSPIPPAR